MLQIFMMFAIAFIFGGGHNEKIAKNTVFDYGVEIIIYHFIILQITLGGHIINSKVLKNLSSFFVK